MPTVFCVRDLLDRHRPPMTQTDLAQRAGVAFATVNRMCTNATSQVSLDVLDRVSAALGVEPGALVERTKARR